MNVLIIGQGIAGSCLAWELKRRGTDFTITDRPIAETASRVAAGLVNPLTGRAFRPGWRQEECLSAAEAFYPETERELGGSWWQKTPIFRELENFWDRPADIVTALQRRLFLLPCSAGR